MPTFKIFQPNFQRWIDERFTSLNDAIAYGKFGKSRQPGTGFHSGGFEFRVYRLPVSMEGGDILVASWSPIGGLTRTGA